MATKVQWVFLTSLTSINQSIVIYYRHDKMQANVQLYCLVTNKRYVVLLLLARGRHCSAKRAIR